MRFRGPYHLFNSAGKWIGFCIGPNVFDTVGVWRGWFPWEGSYDCVKPDGTYLSTVVGTRLFYFQQKQSVRIRRYPVYPGIPVLPKPPAPVSGRDLFADASDVNLEPEAAQFQLPPIPSSGASVNAKISGNRLASARSVR
jgi:hypothetical protein